MREEEKNKHLRIIPVREKGDGDNDSNSPISYWLRDPEDNWFTTASNPTM